MTNTQKRIVFLQRFAEFTQFAKTFEIDFIVTCFYRGRDEQYELYLDGKSKLDGYEHRSAHQDWLAIDIVVITNGKPEWRRTEQYETLGRQWKKMGGIWGGDWESLNDIYHFQTGESSEWFSY